MCISKVAIIVSALALLQDMILNLVSHWKTARAFAILMRIAKELNTGPGKMRFVLNVQPIPPKNSPIQGAAISPHLFTKKVSARYKEWIW